MSENKTVMGWDAAWTPQGSGAWCVIRSGKLLLWETSPQGIAAVKEALGRILAGNPPDLVAIDMPVGRKGVSGYREADRATTCGFSRYGCPVHSPTPQRPGKWGQDCVDLLGSHGLHLCTSWPVESPGIAEVYPHTALLEMKRLSYRFPYKVTRARHLWPDLSLEEARAECRNRMEELYRRLSQEIALPPWEDVKPPINPLKVLKEFEDRIDALICAWAGLQILSGCFVPYGNKDAAIWNPNLNNLDPPSRNP